MAKNNLGPKTGTFEPPSSIKYNENLVEDKKLFRINLLYHCLHALTHDIIEAHEKKDEEKMNELISEFRRL
jgi:hypothetical protein